MKRELNRRQSMAALMGIATTMSTTPSQAQSVATASSPSAASSTTPGAAPSMARAAAGREPRLGPGVPLGGSVRF
ncbi:MAG: hypothetical protein ACOVOZ_09015, partial [Burkholderiaceae bacterium]